MKSITDDFIVVTPDQVDQIGMMKAAIDRHADGTVWMTESVTMRERVIYWTETINGISIDCKCKIDAYAAILGLLWDLKSIGSKMGKPVDIHACENAIIAWRYLGQLGFYERGLRSIGIEPQAWGFLFVTSCRPYDCIPIQCDESMMDYGRDLAALALAKYADCLAAGQWSGVAPAVVTASLPRYLLPGDGADEELEGIDG